MSARMKRSRGSRRRLGRCAQLLVALLLVSSWISSAAHWISTPHRLCEVHRTLEHGWDTESGLRSARVPLGPVYGSEGRSHDECPLALLARTEAAPVPEHDCSRSSVPCPVGWVACLRSEPRPESGLFFLAPSRSPPA